MQWKEGEQWQLAASGKGGREEACRSCQPGGIDRLEGETKVWRAREV